MIVARRLLSASIKPITSALRLSTTAEAPKVGPPKTFHPKKHDEAPGLSDLVDTFKCINYRYDFPQGLTEEQKKTMKRFDIFRYGLTAICKLIFK